MKIDLKQPYATRTDANATLSRFRYSEGRFIHRNDSDEQFVLFLVTANQ